LLPAKVQEVRINRQLAVAWTRLDHRQGRLIQILSFDRDRQAGGEDSAEEGGFNLAKLRRTQKVPFTRGQQVPSPEKSGDTQDCEKPPKHNENCPVIVIAESFPTPMCAKLSDLF